MSKEIKIKYNDTFATKHSRDYYRGASFHWSGKWAIGTHYISDDYNIDFVVHDQALLACAKSHLSTADNEPNVFIRDERGSIIGVVSNYWDFIISGVTGNSVGVKIINNYWYVCDDVNMPEDKQVWYNTGVKASFEFSDLTEEQIRLLQQAVLNDAIKYDTTANWNAQPSFVPNKGTIVVYTDYAEKEVDGHIVKIPGIKVGTGNAYLIDLPFVGEKERNTLLSHISNLSIHTNPEEKGFWNNKLNVDDTQEVLGETLIFNRN